jgi:hypothetical protein
MNLFQGVPGLLLGFAVNVAVVIVTAYLAFLIVDRVYKRIAKRREELDGFVLKVMCDLEKRYGHSMSVSAVAVQDYLEDRYNMGLSLGGTYVVLDRLERNGYLTSELAGPVSKGRRRYFKLVENRAGNVGEYASKTRG